MRDSGRLLGRAADISVIVTSIAICAVFGLLIHDRAKPRLGASSISDASHQRLRPGDSLDLTGLGDVRANKLYILGLQDGCEFCLKSQPEFKELEALASQKKDVLVVAVVPEDSVAATAYVRKLGLTIPVYSASLSKYRIAGTPTVIECDRSGRVLGVWVGVLDKDRSQQILSSMTTIGEQL